MRGRTAPLTAPTPSRHRSFWPVSATGGASRSGATCSSGRCGRRSLRTRTIGAGSLIPYGSERPPRSHTRSTAPSWRLTCAIAARGARPDAPPLPLLAGGGGGNDGRRVADPGRADDARIRHRPVSDLPLARDRRRDRPVRCRRRSPGCPRERPRDCRFHRHRRLNGSRRQDRRPRLARAASRHHAIVRRQLARYRGHERDTAGDGFFATFDGPARAIRAAQAIVVGVRTLGLEARIGIHVGECEVHEGKIAGLAVNIGARVASNAGAGEVLVSQTVRDLVAGSGISFEDRGIHELKGIPGSWQLFAVAAADT